MNKALDLVLLAPHEETLRGLLDFSEMRERAGYLLCGVSDIEADPWTGLARRRFVSHMLRPLTIDEVDSASSQHITWQTDGYMRLINEAVDGNWVPGIVHTHPSGVARFSPQDDRNEAELARTAFLKGANGLLSIVIAGNGELAVRWWHSPTKFHAVPRILFSGPRLGLITPDNGSADFLDRQGRLFGRDASNRITQFRCGIAGGGATGSAVLPQLMRLGVRKAVVTEKDHVDLTNLNRLHGASRSDASAGLPKLTVHERLVRDADLGMELVPIDAWAGDPETWDAFKSCDIIFCCTDDHAGRVFLNRFARYYGIPVIDVGLAMQRRNNGRFDLFSRVSTLVPGHACLLCGDFVDPRRAAEESLRREKPEEFTRLKAEAYVLGEGDPSPAVVSFTTEAACMAINEWLAGVTGFSDDECMRATRVRRFHARDERFPRIASRDNCPTCRSPRTLGRADVQPFLDRVSG
ncbi:MAG: ThiF family adenylyltransferase [Pseudomonadota bacterium]